MEVQRRLCIHCMHNVFSCLIFGVHFAFCSSTVLHIVITVPSSLPWADCCWTHSLYHGIGVSTYLIAQLLRDACRTNGRIDLDGDFDRHQKQHTSSLITLTATRLRKRHIKICTKVRTNRIPFVKPKHYSDWATKSRFTLIMTLPIYSTTTSYKSLVWGSLDTLRIAWNHRIHHNRR